MNLPESSVAAPPKLVLEPVRANSEFRPFPLAPGRYLIGSGSDCDLVIPVGGVAAQHCLMIVGTNRTIVKALSPLTWIEDGPLQESVLQLGQRLILGPIELRTRRPELSEWLETPKAPETAGESTVAPYQPPQIEELLDQARQQLDAALADELPAECSWSEDLSLTEAVNLHSQAASELESPAANRPESERREVELNERSRSLDYLSSELSRKESEVLAREQALQSREVAVIESETRLETRLSELTAREQLLYENQIAFNQQTESLTARESNLMACQNELNDGRTDLLRREEQLEAQLRELTCQSNEISQRESHLSERDAAFAERESSLLQQIDQLEEQLKSQAEKLVSSAVQLSAQEVECHNQDLQCREESIARREAVLEQSLAALKESRQQLHEEAAGIEERIASLMEREQSLPARLSSLQEEIRLAEETLSGIHGSQQDRLAELQQRDQQAQTVEARLAEREVALQESQKRLETRERELRNLRSELDIREEALSQQIAQLQLDRSTLRASQSRLQMAEQSLQQRELQWNQRIAELPLASAQPAEQSDLVDRERALEATSKAYESREAELALKEAQFREQEAHQQQRQKELVQLRSDYESLQAELEATRIELLAARSTAPTHDPSLQRLAGEALDYDSDAGELSRQLESVVSEREAIARLQQELIEEQLGLKAEREELRRSRQQFEQEREQFEELTQQARTERDTFMLERQATITERQAIRDRERQIQSQETVSARRQEELQRAHADLEASQVQFEEERVHLAEEWESLRQERAELAEVQVSLDAQREELTELAQNLAQLRESSASEPVEIARGPVHSPEDAELDNHLDESRWEDEQDIDEAGQTAEPEARADDSKTDEQFEAYSESDEELDEEPEPDALAGFASFSSIGQVDDDDIPPEVAEILRKTAGQYPTPPAAPSPPAPPAPLPHAAASPNTMTGRLDALFGLKRGTQEELEQKEKQRLADLLSKPSEEFVEPVADLEEEHSDSEFDDGQASAEETLDDFAQGESPLAESEPKESAEPVTATSTSPGEDIRSRLSKMFGINLGGQQADEPEPVVEAEPEAEFEETCEEENFEEESYAEEVEPEAEAESEPEPSTENLDPVAAYMEQLLARTRKAKESAVPAKPAKKATPEVSKPATPAAELESTSKPAMKVPEPEPVVDEPDQRGPRKLDAAEKEALRANLDSFRTIANSQARSDVARSELRRLKVTVKVKRVFVGICATISLILISTVFWSYRTYYLEILAGIISTAFLSVDFVRSEKRLRELAATMPEDDEPVTI